MGEGQKAFWFGAGLVIIIAVSGVTLWRVAKNPATEIQAQLAALSTRVDVTAAKLDKTNATLDEVRKATASNANVKTINATLAGIQKSVAAGDVGGKLDALNASIKGADTMLAQIKQALTAQKLAGQFAPLDAKLTTVSDTLAEIKKTASLDSANTQLSALATKLDETNKTLADIKTHTGSTMQTAVADLQKTISDAAALHGKLMGDIGRLETSLKPQPRELMIVYLHMPDANKLPKPVATVSPLAVEFAHIGSADDNGQAAAIIPKLKHIVGGRSGCTISVAGYADTLGGDKTNLTLSKKRAHAIAEKIKTAFAGSNVQINEAAWGERRLHQWTPDNTAKEANRRVDIAVNCER